MIKIDDETTLLTSEELIFAAEQSKGEPIEVLILDKESIFLSSCFVSVDENKVVYFEMKGKEVETSKECFVASHQKTNWIVVHD
jgi:hypothetical protein